MDIRDHAGSFAPAIATSASPAMVDTAAWYELVNRNSGKALDVCGTSTRDGSCAHQYTGNDQTLTISPCGMRHVYQVRDPNFGGAYGRLPYRMGLLTQTNSTC